MTLLLTFLVAQALLLPAVFSSRIFGWPRPLCVFMWIAFSVLAAELVGYLLHRFLHSEKICWLSRSHMEHHLEHYGPLKPMRPSPQYIDATTGRWAIGNVGLEWIAPSALLIIAFVAAFTAAGISWPYQLSFIAITLGWSSLMFSYLHDRMHMRGFWMERNWLLRRWFVAARRLHDIHHLSLNDFGRMDRNFGIGFYFFDRVFGTISNKPALLNQTGVEAARKRYDAAKP
ncbi:MAG TPA: sterol desaturase family protein [Candidatus Acidoferrales bacterium]|nr:sterol desaturase family protein [Candidatus Acidoferrales bacterium]